MNGRDPNGDAIGARAEKLLLLRSTKDYVHDLAEELDEPGEPWHDLQWEWAHELSDVDEIPDDLVRGIITRGAMSVTYGDSNSGKTFAAIHLACAVALGNKWLGREVEAGLVIYLASESPSSVKTRLRAYQRYFGVKVPSLVIVSSPINLSSESSTEAVINLIRDIERTSGIKAVLVIGDTLARLTAGANENSGEDMGIVVGHADRIRAATSAHFMLIHHSGKNAAMGARGWSGLRAATDTEIEVTEDVLTGSHGMELTKQRDLATRGDRIGFRLHSVDMGLGKWGSVRTSCVVIATDAPAKTSAGKRQSLIAGAITEFLTVRGSGIKRSELVKHFESRHKRGSIYREIVKMTEAGELHEVVGMIALLG